MAGTVICTHSFLRKEHFDDRFAFRCNGCGEIGYGSCYTCTTKCEYHLHPACQNAPPIIMSHPFYQQGPFVLDKSIVLAQPYHHQLCAACGTIVEGWRYVSTTNGGYTIVLHPCCMQLPHQTLHPMLQNVDCLHCQSMGVENGRIKGWAYLKDGVALHVWCVKDIVHKGWERRYYSPSHRQTNYSYGTPKHGVGGPANYQVPGRMRKRDYILNGLEGFVQGLSIFSSLGLLDLDSIMDTLGYFLGI